MSIGTLFILLRKGKCSNGRMAENSRRQYSGDFRIDHEKVAKQFKCGYSQKAVQDKYKDRRTKRPLTATLSTCQNPVKECSCFYFIIISLSEGSGLSGADGRVWYQ